MSTRNIYKSRAAFTLLEMILALMITSMTVMTLYRFVSAHLATMRASTELGDERDTLQGVVQYLRAQMNALPPPDNAGPPGAFPPGSTFIIPVQSAGLMGQTFKFHGQASDELTWRTPGGAGILTTAAPGDYLVTLAVQPVTERSSETELGLRRRPAPGNTTKLDLRGGGAGGRYDWLPLVRPMAGLEIRYYDGQSRKWTDAWVDPIRRPALVKVRLWRHADDLPLEAVISVPSARLAQ